MERIPAQGITLKVLPRLEQIAQSLNYGELPETWQVPDMERFSDAKTLYDYQTDALKNAARALYLYYEKEHDWLSGEPTPVNDERKKTFKNLYGGELIPDVKRYETRADENNNRESPVFRVLAEYIRPLRYQIQYDHLINRMCFWMATGSGKTIVMVKMIEYLHSLIHHKEIPAHNILLLAPGEDLLRQIRRTVDEFNQSGLHIELVQLREKHRQRQGILGDAMTVYYHRSDNISDVQKDALTDYRQYENDGKWYVLLDEAHKGSKEDSKRQAYYKVMARQGFLFNFSATFTDDEDILTTIKKYNLKEFVKNGHGKNIYLNEQEYHVFNNRKEEISHDERQKIVLKSLITLAHVHRRVMDLRQKTKIPNLYHLPLMLTLVNSVNTDIEKKQNDLWSFFQTLREIATGEITGSLFRDARQELIDDWGKARLLFSEDGGGIPGIDSTDLTRMQIADLRKAIFHSRTKGALQVISGKDKKELAFQMKNAAEPFALIRIGDTSKWHNRLLEGYEETNTLQEASFFDVLEKSAITILMGSRTFFESWDSNRPNVINFINIGGIDAKKFVVQSVGRGVRIETFPGKRRRFARLPQNSEQWEAMQPFHDEVQPPETLFLFATNRRAVKAVLEGIEAEKEAVFKNLEGFEPEQIPDINGSKMPLLIPQYREEPEISFRSLFSMSDRTFQRFSGWLKKTSDPVFVVRDGLAMSQISQLRGMTENNGLTFRPEKQYAQIPFLQQRLLSHLATKARIADGVRGLGAEDIVHFRHIRVHSKHLRALRDKVRAVRTGGTSDEERKKAAQKFSEGKISQQQLQDILQGSDEETYVTNENEGPKLKIKKLVNHYYLPVVIGDDTTTYIQHIIKTPSEINFINKLERWLKGNTHGWDGWMFSKIDESLDNVHIPYYDGNKNQYRRFLPDFVFWMCKGNQYHIVFVDPKGEAHTDAYHKIDGYAELFTKSSKSFCFKHEKYQVSVKLFLYNQQATPLESYRDYWIKDIAAIFSG